jgi:N6-L-threonylcarbamoyladenine synthase
MTRARGARVFSPRFEFCTDNGAMIAFAGFLRLCSGQTEALAFGARPRWHIDELPSVKRSTD